MIVGFLHPFFLALLILPILLLTWVWRRTGREIAVPIDHGSQSSGRGWRRAIGVFESLPAIVLAVVIFMLAGPQQAGQPRSRRALTNIEFCVDNSASMALPFGDQTRYEASMKAIYEFVDFRNGDAFGLTFFSDATLQWVPLTTDTSVFRYALPFMNPKRRLPRGLGAGTQIGKGLLACRKTLLEREQGDKMIILVSDGASSDLSGGRDAEIARMLKDDSIAVFDIHIASGDVPKEIVNIAYLTDGEVFQPDDKEALAAVFKRIDKMQKAKLEKVAAETHDQFVIPSIAGLSLLGLVLFGLLGVRYTPW